MRLMRSVPVQVKAFAADADAVTQRLATALHEIKVGVRCVDDDGAGGLDRIVVDDLAPELRRQVRRTLVGLIFRRQRSDHGATVRLHLRRRSGRAADRTGHVGRIAARNIGRRARIGLTVLGRQRLRRIETPVSVLLQRGTIGIAIERPIGIRGRIGAGLRRIILRRGRADRTSTSGHDSTRSDDDAQIDGQDDPPAPLFRLKFCRSHGAGRRRQAALSVSIRPHHRDW
jgi:hypothetical protein